MFKKIKGFENYSINEDGVIINTKTNRIMRVRLNNRGYMDVSLTNNKKSKTLLIHRIVAMTFIDNYSEDLQVNHIDGDRQNNNVNNLECLTQQENLKHSINRRKSKNGNISKIKILKLYKQNKFNTIDEFIREIMKY